MKWLDAPSCQQVHQVLKKLATDQKIRISQLELAVEANYSLPTTQKALQLLRKHNYIAIKPGRPAEYHIL